MFSLPFTRIKAALAVAFLAIAAGHAQINPNQILWPTGSAGCVYAPGTNTCIVPTGGAPGTPAGTIQAYETSTTFVGTQTWVFKAGVNGAACDHTTDDTAAFNTLLATVTTAGGGTISWQCNSLLNSAQITIPNDAASVPSQVGIRITGLVASADGAWATPANTALNKLDLQFNATNGKITTLGRGKLELDHLNFVDGASDCAAFLYTTNTTVALHDNLFSGTATGTSACNDVIILGGTTASSGGTAANWFQGYGTYIKNNLFDKIRRGVYFREAANAVVVKDNTWSLTCGATTGEGAVEIGFSGVAQVQANVFSGNLFETQNYPYLYNIWGQNNMFFGDTFWDAGVTTQFLFHFHSSAGSNTAFIAKDGSISESKVSDASPLSDGNSVMDQNWQSGIGLAGLNGRNCNDSSGSGTTQSCNTPIPFVPARGSWIIYHTTTDNTGNLTINVNGSGAASVAKWQGTTTLAAHDIRSGAAIPMFYDGTNWETVTIGNAPSGSSGLSGMTGGEVPIAATASTVTSSKPLGGSGASITTGPSSSTNLDCAQFSGTTGQIADSGAPCGSGGGLTLTTIGSSGAATYSGGTLNIPIYSGGGGSSFPFSVVQSRFSTAPSSGSQVITFPHTTAASGNTAFVLIVAPDSTTVTIGTPSGWTNLFTYTSAVTGAQIGLYAKATASDTSVTFSASPGTAVSYYFFELVGSRTLDTSNAAAVTASSNMLAPALTPVAGSMVISAVAYRYTSVGTLGAYTIAPLSGDWTPIGWTNQAANANSSLSLYSYKYSGTGAAIQPPNLDIGSAVPYAASTAETVTFSIK